MNLENMIISDNRAETPLDPLKIVSQLIHLSLIVIIVTVLQASGWIQIVFTIFIIIYLSIVTVVFFIYYLSLKDPKK